MKTLTLLLCLIFSSCITIAQREQWQATAEAMTATYSMHAEKQGSSFMIKRNEEQFFITAAHLFSSTQQSGDAVLIQLFLQNQWQSFNAKVYFHPNRKIDIAVVKLAEKIAQTVYIPEELLKYRKLSEYTDRNLGISMDSTLVAFGMEVFFYGFPLGNLGTEALGIKFPLVKRAIVSGWLQYDGRGVLVLDGHNNLGFSGGPVVAYNTRTKKMSVIGVVSGYVPEPVDARYKGDKLSVYENSGIIICYEVQLIEEIFNAHRKVLG